MGVQLWILIQLQIHIWVALFDLNLGSTLALAPVSFMSHLSSLCGGQLHIWISSDPYLGCTFYLNLGSTLVPAVVPSMSHLCWLWGGKSTPDMDPAPHQYLGCNFWPEFSLYWYPVNPCYLQNSMFCLITPFLVVGFEIFLHKEGLFFLRWSFWVQQPCVILKFEHFVPCFCLSQY